jgi:hypothetical protein
MTQPIQCGELPRSACLQMGAIALFVPLFGASIISETISYAWLGEVSWRLVLFVSLGLAIVGSSFALWIRARYEKNQEAPNLLWFVLLFVLVVGIASAEWLRALLWSLAVWLGLRWLPDAIFKIGSMC